MFYAFMLILFLINMTPLATDSINVLSNLGRISRNAPYVISERLIFSTIMGIVFLIIIMASSVVRDYEHNVADLLFSTSIRKGDYLLGRFLGSFVATCLLFILAGVGIECATLFRSDGLYGAFRPGAYIWTILVFILPNILFIGGVFFMLATLSKKITTAYIGLFVFLVLYASTQFFTSQFSVNESNLLLAGILDPFGLSALYNTCVYWSVAEKSSLMIPFSKIIQLNRLLWGGMGAISLLTSFYFFSFELKAKKSRKAKELVSMGPARVLSTVWPNVKQQFHSRARLAQLIGLIRNDLNFVLKNKVLWIIIVLGILNLSTALLEGMQGQFGGQMYPYTSLITNILDVNLFVGVVLIISFFTGELIWKEKQNRFDVLFDSLPVRDWMPYVAKLVAMSGVIAIYLLLVFVICFFLPLFSGFGMADVGLLSQVLILKHFLYYLPWILLGMTAQTLAPNKYIGFFLMLVFFIAATSVSFSVNNYLAAFVIMVPTPYTDMAGFGPYLTRILSLEFYWLSLSLILVLLSLVLWRRGTITRLIDRIKMIPQKRTPGLMALTGFAILLIGVSSFNVFYHTEILADNMSRKELRSSRADYEKKYKKYAQNPQPKIVDVFLKADFFPNEEELNLSGHYLLVNKSNEIIYDVGVSLRQMTVKKLQLDKLEPTLSDSLLGFYNFSLEKGLAIGDTLQLEFDLRYERKGFTIRQNNVNMLSNGMMFNNLFFNTGQYVPHLGYNSYMELTRWSSRREFGLKTRTIDERVAGLTNERENLLSGTADWIQFEAITSTSDDQVIAGTGKLEKTWKEGSRNYFHYKSEQPMFNGFVFASAKYKVQKRKIDGIEIEIYHHPSHDKNVDFMFDVVENTLQYASEAFGPYPYSQMRLAEIPDFYTQGQSYPNMLTLTSDFGFMEDYRSQDSDNVNTLAWVLAHEVAHQWWLNQVMPARVPGATIITEALCEYASVMSAKKMLGEDYVTNVIRQRMLDYLSGRGNASFRELPLAGNVEQLGTSQMYVAYLKGAVAMNALQNVIGEDSLNHALKKFFDQYRYSDQYPKPENLYTYFEEAWPDSLSKEFLQDLFYNITLYDHRILSAETSSQDDLYSVDVNIETGKSYVNQRGIEEKTSFSGNIDIGFYDQSGKLIQIESRWVSDKTSNLQFELPIKPDHIILDPYYIFIEKDKRNNRFDF